MLDPKCGPFGSLYQAYANAWDTVARGYEPPLVAISRYNLELTAFALRRARAWLELPTRLSQCRGGADLVAENVRFWQQAGGDYAEGTQRLMAALMSAAVTVPGARDDRDGHDARDYIAVAERSAAATPAAARDRCAA